MPLLPNSVISALVASAEAVMLTRLLPIRIDPIMLPGLLRMLLTIRARRLPLISISRSAGRDDAVMAVSAPEKNADASNRKKIAIEISTMSGLGFWG